MARSLSMSARSRISHIKSKRESRAGGKLIFSAGVLRISYRPLPQIYPPSISTETNPGTTSSIEWGNQKDEYQSDVTLRIDSKSWSRSKQSSNTDCKQERTIKARNKANKQQTNIEVQSKFNSSVQCRLQENDVQCTRNRSRKSAYWSFCMHYWKVRGTFKKQEIRMYERKLNNELKTWNRRRI